MVSIKHATAAVDRPTEGLGATEWDEDHDVPIASQAEAEAGVATDKLMTPLRVAQAIESITSGFTVTATGTGSSQNITLPRAVTVNDVIVFVNGVFQHPTADYTISGTTLTITATSGLPIMIILPSGATGPAGDGVLDGDKGEITVSGGSWTINAGVVTASELASNAVTTVKIADLNVTTAKLDDLAVTTGKLADGAVTTAKIGDNQITTAKIPDNAVTLPKLPDSASNRLLGRLSVGTGNIESLTFEANHFGVTSGTKFTLNTTNVLIRSGTTAIATVIPRYSGTTGAVENSPLRAADNGLITTRDIATSGAFTLPMVNWVMANADYTLSNVATEQRLFNNTANGRVFLPTGMYYFDSFLYITGMSATSGNFAFDPIGAGTAVADRFGYNAYGIDSSTPLNAATLTGAASVTQQSPASVVTAATGTGVQVRVSGMFRVTTIGTIIPSATLVTAAAAVLKAGSWFRVEKIGESADDRYGQWT